MASSKKKSARRNYLFVGTRGHVIAVNKKDGEKVWSTSLPRTGYSVVSILFEDDALFCASGGRVFALDPGTGEILWSNGLPGMGSGLVYLSTVSSNNTEAVMTLMDQAMKDIRSRRAAAAGGS